MRLSTADHLCGELRILVASICSGWRRCRARLAWQRGSETSGVLAAIRVRHVGDPGGHEFGGVGLAEAILNPETVKSFGIVGGPELVDTAQNAKIDPAAAAGAGFDLQSGCLARRRSMMSYRFVRTAPKALCCSRRATSGQPGSANGRFMSHLKKPMLYSLASWSEAEDVLLHVVAGEVEERVGCELAARPARESA